MKINYRDWNWQNVGELEISDEVFDAPVNEDVVAQVVRWQRSKAQSGNHSTKTRSEVSGTNRKPWAQKETGKARQGSLRSPQFRGGGSVFGPKPRSHAFSLNKKIRRLGALSALTDKMRSDAVHVLKDFSWPFSKTKEFAAWKNERNFGSLLFVVANDSSAYEASNVLLNVPRVNILKCAGFNVLDCLKHENVIFDVVSINEICKRYSLACDIQEGVDEND